MSVVLLIDAVTAIAKSDSGSCKAFVMGGLPPLAHSSTPDGNATHYLSASTRPPFTRLDLSLINDLVLFGGNAKSKRFDATPDATKFVIPYKETLSCTTKIQGIAATRVIHCSQMRPLFASTSSFPSSVSLGPKKELAEAT